MNMRYCKGINIADLAEVGVTGRISLGLCKRREREEVKVVDKRKHSFLILELFFFLKNHEDEAKLAEARSRVEALTNKFTLYPEY